VFAGSAGSGGLPGPAADFRLDRIMCGFQVERAEVHCGTAWKKISDHAALSAHLLRSAAADGC
jgi:endonuclease/exonuclease/phosphatase family metal-dependent hydrolase